MKYIRKKNARNRLTRVVYQEGNTEWLGGSMGERLVIFCISGIRTM